MGVGVVGVTMVVIQKDFTFVLVYDREVTHNTEFFLFLYKEYCVSGRIR